MTWPLMERPPRKKGRSGARALGGVDGGAGWLARRVSSGSMRSSRVAVPEAVAVGVVVAEGGDAVVGEGGGHLLHKGSAHGGAGAVAEEHEGDGVVGLEEEGGEVGAGGG